MPHSTCTDVLIRPQRADHFQVLALLDALDTDLAGGCASALCFEKRL